ncbi:MAG: hypothetical protein LCH54_08235 [Bacteroidetes bacterium]|nr:hypothetical protein [Bacteroidota bacterium]
MNKFFKFSLIFLLVPGFALAGSNGSLSSKLGIGTIQDGNTPGMNSIGGAGTALLGSSFYNSMNPAQWVYSRNTHIISGFTYQGISQSATGGEAFSGNIGFNGFLFIIPVKTEWSFGLSLVPYSTSGYEINSTGTYQSITTQEQYSGSGGISQFNLGTGYRVTQDISIGGTFSFYFGNIQKTRSVTYSSTNLTTERVVSNKLNGVGISISGMALVAKDLFSADDRLMASVVLDLPASLSGTSDIQNFSDLVNDTLITSTATELSLPAGLRIGLGYQKNRQFSAALDLVYRRASAIEFQNLPNDPIGDVLTLRMGIAYLPDNNTGARYLERIQYKAGFFAGKNHVILAGKDQDETGVTAGFALPLPGVKSMLDLTGGVTWRGYLTDTSIKETQYSFGLGINLTELWFQKRLID